MPVEFQQRVAGRSGYSISRLIRHALTMITGYSTRPLRWVSAMGLLISLFGFLLLLYVLGSYLTYGRQVEGFTFVAAAVSLFSGVQLLSLGVVGEYIGRIHLRSMGRPAYLVRATTGSPAGVGRDDAVGEAISVVEAVPGAVRAAEAVPVVSAGP